MSIDCTPTMNWPTMSLVIGVLAEAAVILRVMLRPHREPASRIAWVAVIAAIPLFGIIAYVLFGEVRLGRRRLERLRKVMAELPSIARPASADDSNMKAVVPERCEHLFRVGKSISGFDPVGGNTATLQADSNSAIIAMVADIDAAKHHVHVLFYIWLPDNNGRKIAEALQRAASRGVQCRAMVDNLGSRSMIRSPHWKSMQSAGVRLGIALQVGNPLLRMMSGRIDLRNHRKIVVIDGRITYCGGQNCADPEFLIKAKYAPWVDAVMRLEGPIAQQNQHLFAGDWMTYTDERIDNLLTQSVDAESPGFVAQVIGTGPTTRNSAMPELFESLIYSARRDLVISTPYYVPDEAMQSALCSAAYRGVETTIIFPARNDSWIVGGACRSYYQDLLEAGVAIYEYVGGLLHAKSLTVDGDISLIGSANMDRRSFDLNYENNILLYDVTVTDQFRARQREYIARSRRVTLESVRSWTAMHRLWNNALALLGPVL